MASDPPGLPLPPDPGRVAMIGCGNMGGAMLAGWLRAGHAPGRFTIVDPAQPDLPPGIRVLAEPPRDETFDTLVLAIKPQGLAAAASAVAPLIGPPTRIVSILAGTDLDTLANLFPHAAAHVRVMPNLAAALGKSPIALVGRDLDQPSRAAIDALMTPLGHVEWLEDEALMDAVTALAGSGPAFVYRMIDALAQGGATLGLAREQADRLALAMVDGAVALAVSADAAPAELASRVASKGGTTAAGLAVLDAEDRLQTLLFQTLRAAAARSAEMRKEAQITGS